MKTIRNDRSFRLLIILTFIFLTTGFAFLHFGLATYSWILFCLLPVVPGISIGALPNRQWAYYGGLISLFIFLILLLIGQLEGFICVLMALLILVPLIFLGSILTHSASRYEQIRSTDNLNFLLLPLIPFLIGAPAERFLIGSEKQRIAVKTERIYPYSPMEVYEAIKSVDTLVADKPLLMKIDLPVPQKCILKKEAVGGLRICYFSGGTITERITALKKGSVLKMDIIDYQLTGRKWLGFKEAIYYFDKAVSTGCKLTRITTYTSELKPRIYWEPLEKLGIRQEHDYVFDNLTTDLKKKYGRHQ